MRGGLRWKRCGLRRDRDTERGRDQGWHRDTERELRQDRDTERSRDTEPHRHHGRAPPCGAAPGRKRGRCAGSAGAEPGAPMAERGERRLRPGTAGAAAPGSEDEEANPAEEEDEEAWEDGDSGHRRLGEAQLQTPDGVLLFPREGKASRM